MRRVFAAHVNGVSSRRLSCCLASISPSCTRAVDFSQLGDSQRRDFSTGSKHRPDPFARRPNRKCDPYGQQGKPLSREEAQGLLATVGTAWELENEGNEPSDVPQYLRRTFEHPNFIAGSSFLTHVAAVAEMNDHFPSLTLERRLNSRKKAWHVVSVVTCHTKVLQGLSHHDFFLATLIDVESERPEIGSLILPESG